MKAQIVADVIVFFVTHAPSALHHNNVIITYAWNFNFRAKLVICTLYFVVMPHSMVTFIETPFTTTPAHTIIGMRFKT